MSWWVHVSPHLLPLSALLLTLTIPLFPSKTPPVCEGRAARGSRDKAESGLCLPSPPSLSCG